MGCSYSRGIISIFVVLIIMLLSSINQQNKVVMVREIITAINSNVAVLLNGYRELTLDHMRLNERVKLLEQKKSDKIYSFDLSYSNYVNVSLSGSKDIMTPNLDDSSSSEIAAAVINNKSSLLIHDVDNNNIIASSYDVQPITSSATAADKKKQNIFRLNVVEAKDDHSNDGKNAASSSNNDKKDGSIAFKIGSSLKPSLNGKIKNKNNNKNNNKKNNNNKQKKRKYQQQRNKNKNRNKGRGKREQIYPPTHRGSKLCQEEPPGIINGDQCGKDFVIIDGIKYVNGDGEYALWTMQNEQYGITPDPKQHQRLILEEDNKTFSEKMGFKIDIKALPIYKS